MQTQVELPQLIPFKGIFWVLDSYSFRHWMYQIRPQDGVQGMDKVLSISEAVSKRTTDRNNRRQVPDRFSQARTAAEPAGWIQFRARRNTKLEGILNWNCTVCKLSPPSTHTLQHGTLFWKTVRCSLVPGRIWGKNVSSAQRKSVRAFYPLSR